MKKLFCKDSKGKIRVWEIKVENDSYAVRDGLIDGKMKDWTYTLCEPKNIGKINATSGSEQAIAEADALIIKKKKKKYFETIEEAQGNDVFSPMLAEKYKNQKIDSEWLGQFKLDGIRANAFKNGSDVTLLSRERRKIVPCIHIEESLSKVDFDCIIDGELYNHELRDNFNKLVSLIKKQVDITPEEYKEIRETVQYHVYDAYFPQDPNLTYLERLDKVSSLLTGIPYIHIVSTLEIKTSQCVENNLDYCLSLGYEGQMLRRKKSKYKVAGRSKDLLKHKIFVDEEFQIVDIESGIGAWEGAAKKVKVLVDGEIVGCGIDGEREYLKEVLVNKDKYIGKLATVKYFGRTPDNSLRFPVVKDIDRLF